VALITIMRFSLRKTAHVVVASSAKRSVSLPGLKLSLDYLAGFNAPRADPNAFAAAGDLGLNGTKIDIPAPLGNIVRMRDLIAELRTLAADCTNLSHDQLQITYAFRRNMRQS
jgi:hypothetical protein